MKSFVAFFALVAVTVADVSHIVGQRNSEDGAQIVQQSSVVEPDQFKYSYETSNGIYGQESGSLQQYGQESAIGVQGSSSYTSPDGQVIKIDYTADSNGYHPSGAHLPTPPPPQPIPDYILRSIEYNAAHSPKPELGQKY